MVISNTGHCSIHCNCHWVQPYMYTASTQFSKKSEKLALMPQSQVMHGAGGNGVTSCQKNEYFIYKLKSLASLKYINFPLQKCLWFQNIVLDSSQLPAMSMMTTTFSIK